MRTVFIRHGKTAGNLEKRYIGRTDEPLCEKGTEELKNMIVSGCELLVCSPMLRCIQTAGILFPGKEYIVSDMLRECDFGDFEGKNYHDLNGNAAYQEWIESGGTSAFPRGEHPDDFRRRCTCEFERIMMNYPDVSSVVFVVHGGTIMSVLDRFAVPHCDYFEWQCENGHGYSCEWDGNKLINTERI